MTADRAKWPEWLENTHTPRLEMPVDPKMISATFVNHATFFIQHAGLSWVTDPQWSERASPVPFAGPKRVRAPGVPLEKLPKLDYAFISHNHYDHLDRSTVLRLARTFDPVFIVGQGDGKHLNSWGIRKFREMAWWDTVDLGEGRFVTYVPVKHWSARGMGDRNRCLWGGFWIASPYKKIFFAGDTGYCDVFSELRERFGAPSLSLLPIGAYEPRWFMKDSHMNPEEAVQAHLDLGSQLSIAMHFGTWQLTDEAVDQPVRDLEQALAGREVSRDSFVVLGEGGTRLFA